MRKWRPQPVPQPRRMISYRIDPDRRLVLVTITGTPAPAEISQNQAEMREAPDFDPAYALLVDFTQASFARFQPADVRRHATDDPFDPASPHAIVVRQDSDASMVRMFETYSELAARPRQVRAFTDLNTAIAWLDSLRRRGG